MEEGDRRFEFCAGSSHPAKQGKCSQLPNIAGSAIMIAIIQGGNGRSFEKLLEGLRRFKALTLDAVFDEICELSMFKVPPLMKIPPP